MSRSHVARSWRTGSFAVAVAALAAAPALGQTTTVIASSGDVAPGGNGTFSIFDAPVLNDAGQAAFRVFLVGTSGGDSGANADSDGIFRGDGATPVVQIARANQPAPDGNGEFTLAVFPVINEAGQVAFSADYRLGSAGAQTGVARGDGTTIVQIARSAQTAPGGPQTFIGFGIPTLNDAGQAAFVAGLTGTTMSGAQNHGIFRGDGFTLLQIARVDQPAPDGGTFDTFRFATSSAALNSSGQVAFLAGLAGTPGGASDNTGVFRADVAGSSVTRVQLAREGQLVPDGNGRLSTFFNNPAFNDAGEVAFQADLTNISAGSGDRGIYRANATTLTQIARAGQSAAGNGTFVFFNDPVLNNEGDAAFIALLTGTAMGDADDRGIFRGRGDTLTPIAREGQAAPGGGNFTAFSNLNLNDAGQAAFIGELENSANTGIFLFDDALGLLTVARDGDALLGSTITALNLSAPNVTNISRGDEVSGLNALGQVAYEFTLADGRNGVAIYTPIPEPAAFALLVAAGIGCLLRRRPR